MVRGQGAAAAPGDPLRRTDPSPNSSRGVDYDGEWFSERTDIYGGVRALKENRERLVDFSHSYMAPDKRYGDPTGMMTGHLLGKSILDPDPEEDGWWVDLWLKAGDKRVRMIQALRRARGATVRLLPAHPGQGQAREDRRDHGLAVRPRNAVPCPIQHLLRPPSSESHAGGG